jgi:hypothetical protein
MESLDGVGLKRMTINARVCTSVKRFVKHSAKRNGTIFNASKLKENFAKNFAGFALLQTGKFGDVFFSVKPNVCQNEVMYNPE